MSVPMLLATWSPSSLGEWVLTSVIFIALAIVSLIGGKWLFDKVSPVDYVEEIKNKNVAAAIVLAAFLLALAFVIGRVVGA